MKRPPLWRVGRSGRRDDQNLVPAAGKSAEAGVTVSRADDDSKALRWNVGLQMATRIPGANCEMVSPGLSCESTSTAGQHVLWQWPE